MTHTLDINFHCTSESKSISLDLVNDGCWSSMLVDVPAPAHGSIDRLDKVIRSCEGVESVSIKGCAAGALLPVMWLRSIWFADTCPPITLAWESPTLSPPSSYQPAAKLACTLVDAVECDDQQRIGLAWGFVPSEINRASEEAFDLMTSLLDHWDTHLTNIPQRSSWNESLRRALMSCDSLGYNRVAIYGAGTHTRAASDALLEPIVEVVCIIDDDQRQHGHRMWGYEIASREDAMDREVDAVILSANSIEPILWERSRLFREQGIPTIPLYNEFQDTKKESLCQQA